MLWNITSRGRNQSQIMILIKRGNMPKMNGGWFLFFGIWYFYANNVVNWIAHRIHWIILIQFLVHASHRLGAMSSRQNLIIRQPHARAIWFDKLIAIIIHPLIDQSHSHIAKMLM